MKIREMQKKIHDRQRDINPFITSDDLIISAGFSLEKAKNSCDDNDKNINIIHAICKLFNALDKDDHDVETDFINAYNKSCKKFNVPQHLITEGGNEK